MLVKYDEYRKDEEVEDKLWGELEVKNSNLKRGISRGPLKTNQGS